MARLRWWKRHDKDTDGIMGLFPLVYDLPLSCTRSVDPVRKIRKFSKALLKGWDLHKLDAATVRGSNDPEIVLQQCPKKLFLHLLGPEIPRHHDLEPQMYALTPRRVTWAVDKRPGNEQSCNEIRRTGFPLVPDFASTIHAITGQELEHEILDLKSFSESVSEEQQMMAYIGLSRVKRADGLLLADPFSPCLFQQGKVIGPTVLMHHLRGKIPEKALKETLEDLAESRRERKPTLDNMR